MYKTTTNHITVSVQPVYLDSESTPDKNLYVWAYTVKIRNGGAETMQLRARHWKITDAYGRVQEVKGPGVVGEEPVLKPGDTFEYTSGTPLPTPSGIMTGTYSMQAPDGRMVEVDIPVFSLDSPDMIRQLN